MKVTNCCGMGVLEPNFSSTVWHVLPRPVNAFEKHFFFFLWGRGRKNDKSSFLPLFVFPGAKHVASLLYSQDATSLIAVTQRATRPRVTRVPRVNKLILAT